MTYVEKLQDPRWQKKRLEILQRDKWMCKLCKDTQTTFHIHHLSYAAEPWDTPDDDLITYCKHCHAIIEYNKKKNIQPHLIIKNAVSDDSVSIIFIYFDSRQKGNVDFYSFANGKLYHSITLNSLTIDSLHRHFRLLIDDSGFEDEDEESLRRNRG